MEKSSTLSILNKSDSPQTNIGDYAMTTPTDKSRRERTQADIIYEQALLLDSALDPLP